MKQFEKCKISELLPIIPLRTNIVFPHALAPLSIYEEHFAELTWRMFHRLLILNLKLMAYLESTGMDAGAVTLRYALAQVERKRK